MNFKSLRRACAFAIVGLSLAATVFGQEKSPSGDDLLIAAQKICPVSGRDLRAMGGPIKAKSGNQMVFLCCKECVGTPISKENWAEVTSNLATAQGHCPVLNRPLPPGAVSVVVKGRRVFVCCPPCSGKIQASPNKFLAVVDAMLTKNVGQEAGHGN